MLVLDDEVDLDAVASAPRLPKVPGKAGAAHHEGMVKDDQIVALAVPGRDVPSLERCAVVRRNDAIDPSGLRRYCARSLVLMIGVTTPFT